MSQIAETASITLITAVPGSGKTLRAVWYMQQALQAGQQVFCCNVNGLALDGVIDFPDPTKWEELPAGSILVVDECQRFFRAERGVPSYIAAMETIRHMGIRLILLTQHPALIHGNIRALVGFHEHLVRQNGKESVTVYTRSRVIDNVRSDKALATEDHHTWAFPKDCYELYKSAEVHTFKRTVPYKYKRALVLLAFAVVLLGFVVWKVRSAVYGNEAQPAATASAAVGAEGGGRRASDRPTIATAAQYAQQVQPLIDDAPFTAPGFVNRAFVSEPELFCMSSGHMAGKRWVVETCSCVTEQGTRYDLDLIKCADVARFGGRYNPFKPRSAPQSQPEQSQPSRAESSASAASAQPAGDDRQVASYGSMRNRDWPAYTFTGGK